MMQKMTRARIPKAKCKYCNPNQLNDHVTILLSNVCYKHGDDMVDIEYLNKWFPQELQIKIKGKVHLIHLRFTGWTIPLQN